MWSKYNIDALKNKDGTFTRATYRWIKGAMECGHTAHLQTGLGVVAFRPYKTPPGNQRWRLDFYGPYQDDIANRDSEHDDFGNSVTDKLDLIRWAFVHLNGSLDTWLEPHDEVDVWANQAERESYVLATIGDEAIVEYEMPGYKDHRGIQHTTSSLRIIKTIGQEPVGNYKSASYNSVPKKWLAAIKAAGTTDWIGMGQRSRDRIPFPTNLT